MGISQLCLGTRTANVIQHADNLVGVDHDLEVGHASGGSAVNFFSRCTRSMRCLQIFHTFLKI